MAASELTEALQSGESETCEFRSSFGDEALRTLCAFANTRGGTLWVGVRDDRTVTGVTLGKETLRDGANQIRLRWMAMVDLPQGYLHGGVPPVAGAERAQIASVNWVRRRGSITNREYRQLVRL